MYVLFPYPVDYTGIYLICTHRQFTLKTNTSIDCFLFYNQPINRLILSEEMFKYTSSHSASHPKRTILDYFTSVDYVFNSVSKILNWKLGEFGKQQIAGVQIFGSREQGKTFEFQSKLDQIRKRKTIHPQIISQGVKKVSCLYN